MGRHGRGRGGLHIFVVPIPDRQSPRTKAERIFDPFTQVDASTGARHGWHGPGPCYLQTSGRPARRPHPARQYPGPRARASRSSCPSKQPPWPGPYPPPKRRGPSPTSPPQGLRLLLVGGSLVEPRADETFSGRRATATLTEAETGYRSPCPLFAGRTFDLVLMDMEMPGMDGCGDHQGPAPVPGKGDRAAAPRPIIMLKRPTPFSEYEEKCRQAGCDGFLSKPIRKAQLITELAPPPSWRGCAAKRPDTARDKALEISPPEPRLFLSGQPRLPPGFISAKKIKIALPSRSQSAPG